MLGELTASFAHEIGQPLTAIVANAHAARRLLARDGESVADVDEALADIVAAAHHGSGIITGLRALFRKQPSQRAMLSLDTLVDEVLDLLRIDLRDKRIRVHFEREESSPRVLGDPVQLRQVVLNLLVNAEDAVTAGGGPREIGVTVCTSDTDRVALIVRDTGIGAQDAELEHMFERFASSKPGGLGMGLAISRSIVEAHGGRIQASRNVDRGLALHVELPAGAPSTESATATSAEALRHPSK